MDARIVKSRGAVWCAPGGPFDSLAGALEGIRFAREHSRPFLGTCAGFQLAVIEFARNVLELPAIDAADGTARIMRIAGNPFFYLTLFVPQTSSTAERPHPIITEFLATAARGRSESPAAAASGPD